MKFSGWSGQKLGDCPQDVQRVQPIPGEYTIPIMELSGPRLLHQETDIVSRSLIWDLKICIVYYTKPEARPPGTPKPWYHGGQIPFLCPSAPHTQGVPAQGLGSRFIRQCTAGGGACSPLTTCDPHWNPQQGPHQNLLLIGVNLVWQMML